MVLQSWLGGIRASVSRIFPRGRLPEIGCPAKHGPWATFGPQASFPNRPAGPNHTFKDRKSAKPRFRLLASRIFWHLWHSWLGHVWSCTRIGGVVPHPGEAMDPRRTGANARSDTTLGARARGAVRSFRGLPCVGPGSCAACALACRVERPCPHSRITCTPVRQPW